MKYLLQGGESEYRFNELLKLTKISSEPLQDALKDHLVKGLADASCCALNGVQLSNFNRALKTLNEVAETVENIKQHDWQRFNHQSVK